MLRKADPIRRHDLVLGMQRRAGKRALGSMAVASARSSAARWGVAAVLGLALMLDARRRRRQQIHLDWRSAARPGRMRP